MKATREARGMKLAPVSKELKGFLAPYDSSVVAVALATRSLVLRDAPRAIELLYDAYNAVAMGYSFTGRPSEAFCHIAVYNRWVNLGFNWGADLPDPDGLLVGSGHRIRHLRMQSLADVERPFVRRFLEGAIARASGSPRGSDPSPGRPRSVVRAIYARKRRPGRRA
jgi:hypothetical protein